MPYQTARQRLVGDYDRLGTDYLANTQPYHSTRSLKLDVVDADTANGVAFAVARSGQILRFFDYKVGDQIALGADQSHQANEADTNLSKAKSTNGAADMVLEALALSCRGFRIVTAADDYTATDPDVVLAFAGKLPVADPAAIMAPPQVDSPANLENRIMQAVIGFGSIELEWDRKRTEKLGVISQLPEGGASSYLKASGEPRVDNVWRIPEGYYWRRDGQPDGELVARIVTQESVVIPINLVIGPQGETPTAPTAIYVDLVLRLHGLSLSLPSQN